MTSQPAAHVSYAEYLAAERVAAERHEYLDGEVVAMSGGTPRHSAIAANVIGHLMSMLRDRPCRVYTSDLRVRIHATRAATYPDVSVVCGPPRFADDDAHALTNPVVLIEVASSSTENWDRGGKFGHYRQLPSLREYVVIAQDARSVEHRVRTGDGTWRFHDLSEHDVVELVSLECALPLDEIYRNVDGA